jgi:hypothetical protein
MNFEASKRKHSKRKGRRDFWMRDVRVTSIQLFGSSRIDKQRGLDPRVDSSAWMVVFGKLEEPIREVVDLNFHVTVADEQHPERFPTVGSILGIKPVISGIISFPKPTFDCLWTLAVADHVNWLYLSFEEPYRGHAKIINAQISNMRSE